MNCRMTTQLFGSHSEVSENGHANSKAAVEERTNLNRPRNNRKVVHVLKNMLGAAWVFRNQWSYDHNSDYYQHCLLMLKIPRSCTWTRNA